MAARVTFGRLAALAIALMASTALALQLYLLLSGFTGRGETAAAGVWRYFAFFTILTNILVALTTFAIAAGGRVTPGHSLVTGVTKNIVIVGIVYHFLLAALWSPQGAQYLADVLLHYAVPLSMLAYWLILEPKGGITWRDGLMWLVYPAVYLVYALARGALDGFYPYPFIDVATIGIERVLMNAMGLLVAFAVTGQVFVLADGALGAAAMRRALR
jgi:hypothetical protein